MTLQTRITHAVAQALSDARGDKDDALRILTEQMILAYDRSSAGYAREAWPRGAKAGRDARSDTPR